MGKVWVGQMAGGTLQQHSTLSPSSMQSQLQMVPGPVAYISLEAQDSPTLEETETEPSPYAWDQEPRLITGCFEA